jgi:hypothetical protein
LTKLNIGRFAIKQQANKFKRSSPAQIEAAFASTSKVPSPWMLSSGWHANRLCSFMVLRAWENLRWCGPECSLSSRANTCVTARHGILAHCVLPAAPCGTSRSNAGEIEGLAGNRLCILVDQFEELFRFEREISREEAEVFVDLLIGGVDTRNELEGDEVGPPTPPPTVNERHAKVHIVVTMRSEFLGECARFDGLAEAINRTQYLVPRMIREALLRAIQRPAQIYGGEVTMEFAERLIAEVRGREDELPLIQHGLMELWKKASANTNEKIKLDVDLLGKGSSLASLLSNHANEVMKSVAPDRPRAQAVESLFRALIEQTAKQQAMAHIRLAFTVPCRSNKGRARVRR